MQYFLFLVGFVLLIKSADWLVGGSKAVASRFGVSDLVIGLTIVSIGTSMPELVVNLLASITDNPGLAIGNVLGSNIANVLLILGVSAIVSDLPVQKSTVISEIPFSLAAALLVGFLANAALFQGDPGQLFISQYDGIIILFFFVLFMVYIFMLAKEDKSTPKQVSTTDEAPESLTKSVFWICLGMAGLFLGGKWVVDGATLIAQKLGMSQTFIGLTVVAVGTSLPELVTSVRAALKGDTDIAVGNVVGSNIFNLLWILGLSSVIAPLPFDVASNLDILMVIASSSLIILSLVINRRMSLKRWEGVLFVLIYIGYLIFLIKRG